MYEFEHSHGYKSFAYFPCIYFQPCVLHKFLISFNVCHSVTDKLGQCGSAHEAKPDNKTLVSEPHLVK